MCKPGDNTSWTILFGAVAQCRPACRMQPTTGGPSKAVGPCPSAPEINGDRSSLTSLRQTTGRTVLKDHGRINCHLCINSTQQPAANLATAADLPDADGGPSLCTGQRQICAYGPTVQNTLQLCKSLFQITRPAESTG